MEPEERDSLPSINLQDSSMEIGDNSRDIEVGSEIVSGKRKLTSDVWAHFNRIKVDGCQYGECKYCRIKLRAPSKNGTSSLGKHYNLSCKKKPGGSGVRQRPSMANKKVVGSQEHKTFNEEETRRELAMMVVLHDYPLSIVDHVGFRSFVASFKSSFQVMSRNTLKNDIMKIYSNERVKCYNLLEKLKCRIAITTNMWTSSNNKKGFMAITGHYIDDSWVLQSCILRFIYVPAPHTAKALSGQLNRALIDWKINRKLSTITVDNCSTNDVMLARLVEKLPRRDMLLNGKVLHMRCCAPILNLIVKDGLGVITDAIERIRDCVVYWTASPTRVEKFEDCARQLEIGSTKKLSIDCKTRWNSTYLMLETAIIYKDVFPRVKDPEKYYHRLPTDEDWVNATEICERLKFFYRATEMFSGTMYPTSNVYFPNISYIKVKLDEWVKSPNWIVQDMAKKMLEKYDKYWETCHVMMGVAAVLDPRYKMILVEFSFRKIYGEQSQTKIDEIRHNCYELLSDYQSRATTRGDSLSTRGSLGSMIRDGVSSVTDASVDDSLEELHPSTVEALMCSRSWLWKEANGTCPTFGNLSTCPTILDEEEDTVEEEEEECGVERLS
ncbi:hypothetical protein BUALT_BualtUnG0007600 [Buddleja alternifolia]|uniref:BED-type domain-containing protein n=1 Tax=Buddleja alternifolia TaxID=168488 RepID=A0AAV6W483_9LAMI|nr:hypothetical protein BUALT_BualtUnG0007600 [Buddleja alternifolia]